jgi:long-chain acyl-CoA synthetase
MRHTRHEKKEKPMESDVINVMGDDVSPVEVEECLCLHPAIAEAAAIGVPDAHLGQTVKAFVSLKPGAQATPKEIIAFCKERMLRHQYPRQVEIVGELPKNEAGEILRQKLRARESARLRGLFASEEDN